MEYSSPLRYPGGKSALSPFISEIIKINNLEGGSYIEPYAGGAGAALDLMYSELIYKIVLNDKDEFIFSFWKSVINDTENLVRKIYDTRTCITQYRAQKQILKCKDMSQYSTLEKGFAAFYLNRCNRSGILKAGPIGGVKQDGPWKLNARFNKSELIKRIEKISLYQERIEVYNLDAIDFLEQYISHLPLRQEKALIYLDPPYFKKGNDLYVHYYKKDDHIKLSNYFKQQTNFKWLISYDDSSFIRQLYSTSNQSFLHFNYFANKAKIGRELLIASTDCKLPYSVKINDDQSNAAVHVLKLTSKFLQQPEKII